MHKTDFGHFRHHLLRRLDNLRSAVLLDICHTLYSRLYPTTDGEGKLTVQGANQIADSLVRHVQVAVEEALRECDHLINDPELDALIEAFYHRKFIDRYGQAMADTIDKHTVKSKDVKRSLRRRDAAARKIAAFYENKLNGGDPAGHA